MAVGGQGSQQGVVEGERYPKARTQLLELVLDGLSQSLQVVDQDLNLVYANRTAREQCAASTAEPNGKCYHQAGLSGPCAHCPVIEQGASSPCLYALMAQVSPISPNGLPVDGEPACTLVSSLPLAYANGSHSAGTSAAASEDRMGSLIGRSAAMRYVFEMIRLVAGSDATVLLEGESGTGKELVARTIHALSRRSDRPFVVIDCGALPETLLESELFGHVRGAFTGAVAAKSGLFEEAAGGTILLDEIADMSPVLQAKLLRVIQEGEIKPVGGNRRIKVDARIIAASNKPVVPLVAAKAFREDLYYRLAVIPLAIPPLRQRQEDIPVLVEAFVAECCGRYSRPSLSIPREAMGLLQGHDWPGNVRELRHVIERAVLTATGSELEADRLFADLFRMPATERSVSSLSVERHDAIRLLERARIVKALRQANGNKALAARSLKISRASFYNKLHQYQIHPSAVEEITVSDCHNAPTTV